MKLIFIMFLAMVLTIPWFVNGYKFLSCDFKSDYKCEIIHGAGVFMPPFSYITIWFDLDEAEDEGDES